MKLDREEHRLRKKRQMETDAKVHEREMQRAAHEASQLEEREKRESQLGHLARLRQDLGMSGEQLAAYLLAMEQGPPDKLIQISGKEANGNGFVHLQEQT